MALAKFISLLECYSKVFRQNLIFQSIVMYPPPSIYTCTARIWLREIGFSLTYGALMLKTWRLVKHTHISTV